MGFDLLSTVAGVAKDVIGRVLPDPAQRAAAEQKLLEMQINGELATMANNRDLSLAQVELDKIDAASQDKFQSRWRPFVGWVCGVGLLYAVLIDPLIRWACARWAPSVVPPAIDVSVLMTMLTGMLGLSGMRTYEKITIGKK